MTAASYSNNRLRLGMGYVWRGIVLIREPKIRRFVVVPLLINIVLFALGIICIANGIDSVMSTFLPSWLGWLKFLLWPLFLLASMIIVFYGFTIVANIIASPFNGLLAAAVEQHLRGTTKELPSDWRSVGRDIARSIGAELRKLAYFVGWAVPCLLLFMIPGVNLIAAPLWFLFGAWMMAIEYIDVPLSNQGKPFPAVKHELRQRRRLALGFGSTIMLMTMVPIVNFIAMPVGVAAAAALCLEQLEPANRGPQAS